LIETRPGLGPQLRSERWVCLDVGETLIDETRVCDVWAQILGVTPFSLMAAYGAAIVLGRDHRTAFDLVGRPDWPAHQDAFEAAYGGFGPSDLYPDVLPALDGLRRLGYRLAIVANQPRQRNAQLRAIGIRVDLMAMSDELGVHKPSPEFYSRALELMEADASDVAYVGDRLDNDVLPSFAAGMRPVWLKRGPWGIIVDDSPPRGALVVSSLTELVERIGEAWPATAPT
jgi:HAD superfamily hydrolase (TIGR01662 family)